MPRSLWTGSLSFGLVNVPVQLVSAVRDQDLHFRQLHEKDGAPIETQRWCSKEGKEVPWEEITHSYEFDDGEEVVVSDEELASVEPVKTRTIDIEQFVELADVDPIYLVHPYFVVPAADDQGSLRAYRLLAEVMGSTDRAALGRFVMRAKEYLALVRVRDGVLTLSTMRFHDEVRDSSKIPGRGGRKAAKGRREDLVKIIEALSTDWDPERCEDRYRKRLEKIVAAKRKGRTIRIPKEEEAAPAAPDLVAALEESLSKILGGGGAAAGRGTGEASELKGMSKKELYERAKKADVPGRGDMSKEELVAALSDG